MCQYLILSAHMDELEEHCYRIHDGENWKLPDITERIFLLSSRMTFFPLIISEKLHN
jgi:hypothetical protein